MIFPTAACLSVCNDREISLFDSRSDKAIEYIFMHALDLLNLFLKTSVSLLGVDDWKTSKFYRWKATVAYHQWLKVFKLMQHEIDKTHIEPAATAKTFYM